MHPPGCGLNHGHAQGHANMTFDVVVVVVMVCRDLRPANVLLGDRGHILLTYFSQWNTVECRVSDQAFDSLYCAPGHYLSYFVIMYLHLPVLTNIKSALF